MSKAFRLGVALAAAALFAGVLGSSAGARSANVGVFVVVLDGNASAADMPRSTRR